MSKYKFMRLTALFLSVIMLFNTVTMDVLATGTGEMETIKIEEAESAESSLKEAESAGSSSQESESLGVIGSMTTEDMFADNASSSVGIIGEDTSKREANMKVFLNEDFTYTAAIYPTAVHYMENGQWKDINNTLQSISLDGDGTFVRNTAGAMAVSFGQDTSKDKLVHITVGDYQLWWGMDTGSRIATRSLVENSLDIMDKKMPLILDDEEEIGIVTPPDDLLGDIELPDDLLTTLPDGTLGTESESSADHADERESDTTGSEAETEADADTGSKAETESDADIGFETETIKEKEASGEILDASLESRETRSNQSAVADNSSETDTSLVPVDNEPVGENTIATLITENPDAAKLAEQGDTEALRALEEASASGSAAAVSAGLSLSGEKAQGILPSLQKTYASMDDAGEETKDDDFYKDLISANQSSMSLEALESRVFYENIGSGVDLEYVLEGSKLKENIILASADSNKIFTYDCMMTGLAPVLADNEILFKDASGETVLYIQAPFMYDKNGEYSDAVTLGLESGGDCWHITISADQAWLDDEDRAFPVVIDPVIVTPQEQFEIKDTKVCSNYPNTNYRDFVVIATGYESVTGDSRSYMKFNIPDMDAADIVVDAQVVLYSYTQSGASAQVDMHKVTGDWDSSTITWNTKASYDPAVADYQVFTDTRGTALSFSITDIVQGWYRGEPNYGVMIKDSAEEGCYREFLSSDCYSDNKELRPAIYITYLNATGLEGFWTYHSQSVGRAGTGHVNDFTGNLVFVHDTAATSGLRLPAALAHVYNSADKDVNLGYGYGFRLNYHQTVTQVTLENKEDEATSYYKYVDEDGTAHYFKYDSEKSKWLVDSGIDLELVIGTDAVSKYTIRDKSDQKLIFNSDGYLVKVQDQNNNALSIEYTGNKISKITDGAGKTLALSYDSSGNLSSVVSPDGTKSFAYTNGDLTTITDIDSKTVSFTYSSNLMTKAANIDGYSMNYTYTSTTPAKVASVAEKAGTAAGQSVSIVYDNNFTSFTDHKDRTEYYTFNSAGNTVAIYNDDGYAETAKYLTDEGVNKNKVSKTSKLQYTVVQMLKNPDATSLASWTGSGSSYSLNTSASNARIGSTSLKVTMSGTAPSGFSQTVTVEKGETYTFSAYVRPDTTAFDNSSAMVQIGYRNSSGTDLYKPSSKLIPSEDGWYRLETTVTIPADSASTQAVVYVGVGNGGTAYFDCMQFEQGDCASRYNLIENNDFSDGTTGYTFTGTDVFDNVVNLDSESSAVPTAIISSGYCTTSALNVRSGAGTGYGVVASLSLNTRAYILGSSTVSGTVWYNVAWPSGQRVYYGWATSAYINKDNDNVSTQKALINTTTLNVRAGAGTGYSAIGTVSKGTEVKILQSIISTAGQEWYMIHYTKNSSSYTGCVLAKYVLTIDNVLDTGITPPSAHTNELDNKVLMLYGNPGGEKKVTQTVNVSGSKDDAFVVNLWAAGNPVKIKDSRTFGVEVVFVASDGTKGKAHVSSFEETGEGWMFLNDVVIADKDYAKIKVSYTYSYNDNVVYFDGLSLFKEEYGSSYIYDENGNVTTTTDAAEKSSSFEYDDGDNLTMFKDAKGNKFNYVYDTRHNVTQATSAANMKYTFAYDSYGNATESNIVNASDDDEFIKTVAAYNSTGSLMTSITDPLGNTISYSYDEATGRLTKATDARGNDTSYTYNTKGQVTSLNTAVTDANGQAQNAQASYTYTNDYLTGINYHGQTYSFVYDGFGNKTAVKQGNTVLVSYTYGANNGNLLTETFANGIGFVYNYDKYDRLISVTYKASQTDSGTLLYSYKYSKDGNLAVLTEALDGREYRYYYDLTDRLVKVVDNNGYFYTYFYDANDNLTKVEEGVNSEKYTTTYTYDADNRETQTNFNQKTYATTYDALGRITKKSFNTTAALDTVFEYNAGADGSQSAQLKSITNGDKAISYEYDAGGNITKITDDAGTTTYVYDELNQLVRENNHLTGQTVIYLYDAYGNILSKKIYPKTDAAQVSGEPADTVTYGYDTVWTDKMVSFDGSAITYDLSGNPLSYRGRNLIWIKDNLLYDVNWDGKEFAYSYNPDGIRVEKLDYTTYAHTNYQLTDGLIAAEKRTDGTGNLTAQLVYTYDSNDSIIAMRYNGVQYFYIKNAQGDIIGIADGSGNVIVEYTYDSWGKVLSVTGDTGLGNANPFRYRGYYYDVETGFYYLYGRYYDPEVGRFLNADDTAVLELEADTPIQDNLFAYCMNNPVNMVDERGTLSSWATKLLVGTAVIAVVAVVSVATAGTGTALACFAAGALKGAVAGAVAGAAEGAITGAVTHRVTTGSWKGAGKAALESGADGFMKGAIFGSISGGMASKACFIAGTLVLTSVGHKVIEDVEAGDLVWAHDPDTGETALKEVLQTFVNETTELVHVFANGNEIVTTPEHPFYEVQKGWTASLDLRAGDILVLVNGEYVIVEKIQHEILESPIKVYNFEVEGFHTYFVGDDDVLVHNMCKTSKITKVNAGRQGRQKQLAKIAHDSKISKTLRNEMINRYKQKGYYCTPVGYNLAHRAGYEAKKGYDYSYTVLQLIKDHKTHHRIMRSMKMK